MEPEQVELEKAKLKRAEDEVAKREHANHKQVAGSTAKPVPRSKAHPRAGRRNSPPEDLQASLDQSTRDAQAKEQWRLDAQRAAEGAKRRSWSGGYDMADEH